VKRDEVRGAPRPHGVSETPLPNALCRAVHCSSFLFRPTVRNKQRCRESRPSLERSKAKLSSRKRQSTRPVGVVGTPAGCAPVHPRHLFNWFSSAAILRWVMLRSVFFCIWRRQDQMGHIKRCSQSPTRFNGSFRNVQNFLVASRRRTERAEKVIGPSQSRVRSMGLLAMRTASSAVRR